jgi:hypothetical protein
LSKLAAKIVIFRPFERSVPFVREHRKDEKARFAAQDRSIDDTL